MDDIILTEREEKAYKFILNEAANGSSPTVREICKAVGISSTSVGQKIISRLESLSLIEKRSRSSRSIRPCNMGGSFSVPILGKVAAGIPILAFSDVEGYIPVPKSFGNSESLFALRVKGMSMKNAGILSGDVVVADRNAQPAKNDIVIALINDEATVKRLIFENGKAILMPENPDFEPIIPETLVILGKVVGSYRQY